MKLFICVSDTTLPVDCARDILGVSFSENPNKYFFILRTEHMVVEADSNIQEIMEKLQTYRNRLTLVFEVCISIFVAMMIIIHLFGASMVFSKLRKK